MTTRDDVAAMLRAGATYREITDRLGVGKHVITTTRRHFAIPVPEPRAHSRPHLTTAIAELLRAGATQAQIRAQLNVSPTTITRVRRAHNIPRHPAPRRTLDETLVIFRLTHHRDPDGYVRPGCDQPWCIHGPHLTDRTIRTHQTPEHTHEPRKGHP